MSWLEPITLPGKRCTLKQLSTTHHDDLIADVKDGELWRLWYTLIPSPDEMQAEIDRRLSLQKAGSMLPFTIIDNSTEKPIGMTTFLNADPDNRRIEIGSTWLKKSITVKVHLNWLNTRT